MTKIGVGVGEEFPVDEQPRANQSQEEVSDGERFHCHGRHRAWRQFKRQMHEEWHARRRAFRDSFQNSDGPEAVHAIRERHLHHLVVGGLALIGVAALLGILSHRD